MDRVEEVKMKKSTKLALTSLAVTFVLAACIVGGPLLHEEPEEVSADPVLIPVLVQTVSPGLGLGLFAAGVVTGMVLMYLIMSQSGDSIDPEIARNYRNYEAELIETNFGNVANVLQTVTSQDSKLWRFTESHWSRAQELAVADLYAYLDDYNGDILFNKSLGRATVANHTYTMQSLMDFVYYDLSERGNAEYSKGTYDKSVFNYGIRWDGDSLEGNRDAAAFLYPDSCVIAIPTADNNLVYLDTELMDGDRKATSGMIYISGAGTMTHTETLGTYTATDGVLDMTAMPSGVYSLSPGAMYGGNFTPSLSANAAELTGGMIINHESGQTWAVADGDGLRIIRNGAVTESSALGYFVDYDGPIKDGTNDRQRYVDLAPMIRAWDDMISSIEYVTQTVDANGQATWDIFDSVGSANAFVSPSTLYLVNENVSYTADQRRMMYVSAMEQVSGYYQSNKAGLSAPMTISKETMDLYCHGDIYLNGTLVIENAVFSPMTYLESMELSVGMNKWDAAGACMIWDTAEDMASWGGTAENGTLLPMASDGTYTIEIDQIVYGQTSVPSVTLTMTEMSKMFVNPIEWDPAPEPPDYDGTGRMIALIVTLLGVLVAFAGFYFRSPVVIILGIVMIFLGFMVVESLYAELLKLGVI